MGREKISLAYIYLHKPVILLEVVLLLIEVYKMFETGKKLSPKLKICRVSFIRNVAVVSNL